MNFLSLFGKTWPSSVDPIPLERLEIPLLPLGAVLFPGGLLSLKLSEQKYIEMAADCLENGTPFGVCLAGNGKSSEVSPDPHELGTLAHVRSESASVAGVLALSVRGGRRFRTLSREYGANGLIRAKVELLAEPVGIEVPAAQRSLLPLLRKVVGDLGVEKIPEPHDFDDAAWVGYRLTEVMPVQLLAKQKLLELEDPVSRLEVLYAYLSQRKLLI